VRVSLSVGALLLLVSCRPADTLELHAPNPPGLPIFVGVSNNGGRLLHMERPRIPATLRYLRANAVQLKCRVLEDGRVSEITLQNGPPELLPFARAAVARWRYEPFRVYDFMMGRRIPQAVITVIDLRFQR
jgi:hypothetical protein